MSCRRTTASVTITFAVLYPEGYLTEKQIYLFNHDDVVKVEYLGYMNAEYQVFRQDLEQIMKEVDAEKK